MGGGTGASSAPSLAGFPPSNPLFKGNTPMPLPIKFDPSAMNLFKRGADYKPGQVPSMPSTMLFKPSGP